MTIQENDYCFDDVIDRRSVPALKTHPLVLGDNHLHLFAAGVADMDFKAPPVALNAMQRRLDHGVFGYEALSDKLIPALTNWLSVRHHWDVDENHILRAPNVLNGLAMAANIFTGKGDGIIVQPPVFFDFFDIVEENKRTIIRNPLILKNAQYVMDFDDLEKKASDPRAKMIYLCNPHNPVGRVWRKDELRTLGDICLRHNVIVVTDEIHGDITFPGHPYTPFASLGPSYAEQAISLLSPAKTFNIAANCSSFVVIDNARMRQQYKLENSRLTINKNNAFANVCMHAVYEKGGPWLDDVLIYLADNIKLVKQRIDHMPGVELIEPEGTFLLWIDFRGRALKSDQLDIFLKSKAHWATTRGIAFGTEGNGFARVNIACPRTKLIAALDDLEGAFRGHPL